jgi:hydrogenase-1 operon protein HyaF
MSRLSEISIRIEAPTRAGGLGDGVGAVLSELVSILERVAAGGDADTIDLRSLPISPEDRSELQAALGQGEVRASLQADGVSILQETAVSGIWWVEHRDGQGDLIAELIEVSAIPAILKVSPEDMVASARSLRTRLADNHAVAARTSRASAG